MRRMDRVSGAIATAVLLTVVAGCGGGPVTVTSPSVATAAPAPPPPTSPLPPGTFSPVQRIIWGRVLDADSGAPVAGARVALWLFDFDNTDREVAAVITTGDGRFNLTGDTFPGLWVQVQRNGYEPVSFHRREWFDFTGDVVLSAYKTLLLRPGEAIDLQILPEWGYDRCGLEGTLYCRRLQVDSVGRGVVVEASADDRVTLVTDPYFQDYDRDFQTRSTFAFGGGELWIVRGFTALPAPPARVRLTARLQ
jgi:5-hydroxyisourate hydrolase-like protein (transthyretin family)